MSETTNDATGNEETPVDTPVDNTDTNAPAEGEQQTEGTNWKEQSRKWEARAKADKALADKWREYESSQKTDYEKLVEELTAAKTEAASATANLIKYEIAAEKQLPANALALLKGATREELEAEADILLTLIADPAKPKQPQPNPEQGKPAGTNGQISKEELSNMKPAEIMAARREGRLDDILGVQK